MQTDCVVVTYYVDRGKPDRFSSMVDALRVNCLVLGLDLDVKRTTLDDARRLFGKDSLPHVYRLKPVVLRDVMIERPGVPLLYIDADCIFLQRPKINWNAGWDIGWVYNALDLHRNAAWHEPQYYSRGAYVLAVSPTESARCFVNRWIERAMACKDDRLGDHCVMCGMMRAEPDLARCEDISDQLAGRVLVNIDAERLAQPLTPSWLVGKI